MRKSKIIVFILLLVLSYLLISNVNKPEKESLNIILSPHFDDAVLSLGGHLATKNESSIVVTFFGGKPGEKASTHWDKISGFKDSDEAIENRRFENRVALRLIGARFINFNYLDSQYRKQDNELEIKSNIQNDISSLLEKYKNRKINVFGPADFGNKITHKDHKILHDAFVASAKSYPRKENVNFYIYEDFPYILRFQNESTVSLKKHLEEIDSLSLSEKSLEMSTSTFLGKIKSIETYNSQEKAFANLGENIVSEVKSFNGIRCKHSGLQFCETVYLIQR